MNLAAYAFFGPIDMLAAWGEPARQLHVMLLGTGGVVVATLVLQALLWRSRQAGGASLGRVDPVECPDGPPPDVTEYLDSLDGDLQTMGFVPAGTYQVTHGPQPVFTRYYTSSTGEESAELSVLCRPKLLGFDRSMRTLGFVTIFDDGTYLETANLNVPEELSLRPPQMVYRARPGASPPVLLDAHRAAVQDYQTRQAAAILRYPPHQLAEVCAYYMQYQRDYWQSKGIITPPRPTGEQVAITTMAHALDAAEVP